MLVKRLAACTHLSSTISEIQQVIGRNCDIFTPHLYLATQKLSEFREDLDTYKTRMNGLSCGEESMTIYSAILIQYQRVTDGRMDVQPISITCLSIADARKNRPRNAGVIIENISGCSFLCFSS